jgi:hypothetical protein
MTSPAKIAANRRNARRSTGPRSAAGKARARRNAFRHGLTTPASLDHVAMDRIDNLVDALTIDVHSQLQFQLATVAAEAQAEIERVRQTKVNLVNRASAQLREEGAGLLSAGERAALAFAGKTEILMACERYERRAISRRNRALHALAKLQRELRREEVIEVVGPPRPKSSPRGRVNFSCTCEWHFIKNMYREPGKSTVGVYVTADDHHGFLHLRFEVNGEPIAQTFELAGKAMRVGGVRWTVKCPESGKMVRDLYLVRGPNHTHFRSRHALGLSYCSNWRKKRHGERARKLVDRLGAQWREPPIRPKNMQRRTFKRLVDELWEAWLSDAHANLGVWLDRDALVHLGSAELYDIARKRVIDIALRRRRRKSSN